ncbi:MAG: HNH endonuclease [Lewinellaceae bacterium]|nr:HNH endonuclease [Lewinellaceae bacterium]
MSISLKTHKMLWGRSGNMCAFPNCKKELVMDESETDDASVIGEEAHIIARKENGPRGKSDLPFEERDKYNNLILLCSIHHKLIDDQETTYTVEKLHKYKREHEDWVKNNLSQDFTKLREEEIYASYVDKFIELAEVDNWKGWTSFIFGSGQPSIHQGNLNKLRELIEFIISRVWSGRYPELERAFYNFKYVANDFISVFEKYSVRDKFDHEENEDNRMIWTKKFYKIDEWNPELYQKLGDKYDFHCYLVEDLALEMTRAANYLFDMVRKYLFPGFRINEGVLLIQIGPFMDLSWKTIRIEYRKEEKENLYQGLREFMENRINRDYHRGEGVNEDYFPRFH